MEKIKLGLAIGLAIFGYIFGYKVATTAAELRFETFKTRAANDYASLLEKKIEGEKRGNEMRHRIETNYTVELERQRQSYENLLANLHASDFPDGVPVGAPDGGGMPRTEGSPSDAVCFGKADFRRRVVESVAIAHRCDELAIKYNALLGLYQTVNEELARVNNVRRN